MHHDPLEGLVCEPRESAEMKLAAHERVIYDMAFARGALSGALVMLLASVAIALLTLSHNL